MSRRLKLYLIFWLTIHGTLWLQNCISYTLLNKQKEILVNLKATLDVVRATATGESGIYVIHPFEEHCPTGWIETPVFIGLDWPFRSSVGCVLHRVRGIENGNGLTVRIDYIPPRTTVVVGILLQIVAASPNNQL